MWVAAVRQGGFAYMARFQDTTRIRYGINRIAPLQYTVDTQQILEKLGGLCH